MNAKRRGHVSEVDLIEPNPSTEIAATQLDELAARINAEHRVFQVALRTTLDHARTGGDLLIQARTPCLHGSWLPYREALRALRAPAVADESPPSRSLVARLGPAALPSHHRPARAA